MHHKQFWVSAGGYATLDIDFVFFATSDSNAKKSIKSVNCVVLRIQLSSASIWGVRKNIRWNVEAQVAEGFFFADQVDLMVKGKWPIFLLRSLIHVMPLRLRMMPNWIEFFSLLFINWQKSSAMSQVKIFLKVQRRTKISKSSSKTKNKKKAHKKLHHWHIDLSSYLTHINTANCELLASHNFFFPSVYVTRLNAQRLIHLRETWASLCVSRWALGGIFFKFVFGVKLHNFNMKKDWIFNKTANEAWNVRQMCLFQRLIDDH